MANSDKERVKERYDLLGEELADKEIDIDSVKEKVSRFEVEVPSWVFGPFGGGRFSGYIASGAARNVFEKFDDAALVHRLTGATPRVAIHIGWDDPDEAPFDEIRADSFKKLKAYAEKLGLEIGAVNPTYFLEGTQFGSLSSKERKTRERLIEHSLISAEVAQKYGTGLLTLWFPDGSLYPGQVSLRSSERRLKTSLKDIYRRMPESVRMLIEYKLFEPGTYHTVVSDVSVAKDLAKELGDRAGVLIDLGHHAHGVNVEHIVARLIEDGLLGGVHFNTRYAADDDLSVEPNMQVFRIFHELVTGEVIGNRDQSKNWTYVIDQCSALENRIHAVLHTVDSLTISYAKALIVDQGALIEHQNENEIILANRTLNDAFLTDVRPIIGMAKIERGLPVDSISAYIKSGYQRKIEQKRSVQTR